MKTFCDQERFNADAVESVTGIKSETLRQWEKRDVYTCEFRRSAEFALHSIQSPDAPRRQRKARELLQKQERGWRSYTLGDLMRISYLVELMQAGVPASEAGRAATFLCLPESEPNSHPSGRTLAELLSAPDLPDEYAVFVPNLLHLGNPATVRYEIPTKKPDNDAAITLDTAGMNWNHNVRPILRMMGDRAAVVLNLSRLRRNVLHHVSTSKPISPKPA